MVVTSMAGMQGMKDLVQIFARNVKQKNLPYKTAGPLNTTDYIYRSVRTLILKMDQ